MFDGDTLLFESDRSGGVGNVDLYQAQATEDWYRFTLEDGQSATLALQGWMIVEAILLWPRAKGVLEEPLPALPQSLATTAGGRSC